MRNAISSLSLFSSLVLRHASFVVLSVPRLLHIIGLVPDCMNFIQDWITAIIIFKVTHEYTKITSVRDQNRLVNGYPGTESEKGSNLVNV